MKSLYISIVGLIALAGCATPNVTNNFDLQNAGSSGVIIGSITYEGGYAAYILHIESADGRSTYRVQHGAGQTLNPVLAFKGESQIPALGKKGSVFAVEIPAGNYRVQGWQISSGPTNVRSTAVTGIEFKVEAKTAIYLGNYDFKVTDTFMRNPSRATVTLREQRDRDLAAFKSAFPALAAVSVETTIADKIVLEGIGGPSVGRISLPIYIPTAR